MRAAGWAAIILCMELVLSIFTCFYCCCMSCVCCVRGREKPTVLKLLLGVVTGAIVLVAVIIMFVSLWAESSLHDSIYSEATNKIVNFTSVYTDPGSAEIVQTVVLHTEAKRHWVVVGYFVVLLLFLMVVLAVIALAPICKTGIGVIVVIVLMGFFTVINSVLVASIFAVIVVYADVCVRLFGLDVGHGVNVCDVPVAASPNVTQHIADWVSYLDVFCNKSINYGFILFVLSVVLIVLFILIQIFGFAYGASFFGRKPDTVTVGASEMWDTNALENYQPALTTYNPSYAPAADDDIPLVGTVKA